MIKVSPMLTFRGQAGQALKLYEDAFNTVVEVKMTYADAGKKGFEYKEENKDFIYYSQLSIGSQAIMVSDDPVDVLDDNTKGEFDKSFLVDLVVEFDSDDMLKSAYDKMAEGATITQPLHSPHYCSLCVVFVDRFGGRWQFLGYGK